MPIEDPEKVIRIENLHISLGGVPVLRGLDFDLVKGETHVIIGRSGTGKSVTLKNILGLLRPDEGRVFIYDQDMTGIPEKQYAEVRKKFGVLFQSGALINWLNVGDNVALPLREHTSLSEEVIQSKVREKLALLDMSDAANKMPSEISGGMKKRAGLARGIILDPEIVLYDEPTSGLDPVLSNQINELILRMQEVLGITSVVVTHDMESAYMIGDRISMLYDGKIVQTGTREEIQRTVDPVVSQFIHGQTEGPITAR
ncbi:MAG: ABC transporter ATP-binding protein [Planctomycetota bacterium]|jgi:phospholipid/cholesterol/gamma-HCH transport system ATP-binding protein